MTARTDRAGHPFTMRGALILVLGGAVIFLALLWMIGAGLSSGPANDGGNHGEAKGLNGFAAFARLLESRGYDVRSSRSELTFREEGLLILTPPHGTDANELNRILVNRRRRGPTLLILPKWQAMSIPAAIRPPEAKEGWVNLGGPVSAPWAERLRYIGPLDARTDSGSGRWSGMGLSGGLPEPKAIQTISSGRIAALVRDSRGQVLAGYWDDGRERGRLSPWAKTTIVPDARRNGSYPLLIVAEPDLLDNWGMSHEENARLAMALVEGLTGGKLMPVAFDLTLNGHARQANLLTLAFTPPFLAATLCLMLAALAIGWRAFLRLGPARKPGRAIAFGKTALVANAAGLVRRTRRLHLLTGPYADRARERILPALAIGRQPGRDAAEAAIDRALAARDAQAPPFSRTAARLRAATSTHQALAAARDLHALERKLIE